VFGARLNPLLDRLALARPAQMRQKARDYGLNLANPEERRAIAEELLAEIAQYEPNLTIIDRLIVAVRDWLRMIGFELEWSDADVISKAILPARRFVVRGPLPQRANAQPVPKQRGRQRAFRDAEKLANIVQGAAFREQGLRGLEVPQQRVVLAIVVGAIRNAEVRRPVDVVNDLAVRQGTPETLLGQPPVLKDLAAINSQDSIPVRVDAADALVRAVARIAAERLGPTDERAFPLDFDAAIGAAEADATTARAAEAGVGAERAGVGARSGRSARERDAASGTGKIDDTQDAAPIGGVELDASGVRAPGASSILADEPAAARGPRLSTLLRRYGQQPASPQEAARWLSDGWRVFVAHDLDEQPFEVTNVDRLLDYTYAEDQMIGLPPWVGGTPALSRRTAAPSEAEVRTWSREQLVKWLESVDRYFSDPQPVEGIRVERVDDGWIVAEGPVREVDPENPEQVFRTREDAEQLADELRFPVDYPLTRDELLEVVLDVLRQTAQPAGGADVKVLRPSGAANDARFSRPARIGRVLNHLTPSERAKLNARSAQRVADLYAELPSAAEMADVALAGSAKRGWYKRSARALVAVFGEDAPRFAALLAALSPQTSVENNLLNAVRSWTNWQDAGRPTQREAIIQVLGRSVQGNKGVDSVLNAWKNNAVAALTADDPTEVSLSGPKVSSFYRNLMGITNEVTNDAWMANFAAIDKTLFAGALQVSGDPGKGGGYLAMSAKVREAAKILTKRTGEEWTPDEVQETIWSWAKTLYELGDRAGETRSLRQLLQGGELTDEAIGATPDFARLLNEGPYSETLRAGGYAEGLRVAGAADQGGGTGERIAERLRAGEAPTDVGFSAAARANLSRAAGRLDRVRRERAQASDRPAMARGASRSTWDTPEPSKLDDFLYTLQDKQIDLKRIVQAIKAKVGQIADRWNPYLQEELYHGRTAKRVKDFLDFELRPLLTDMQMRGVELAEFEKFLHARHAEERNVQIAKINPKMPDGGSGMTTADAQAHLAGIDPAKRRAFEALAKRVDAISNGTRSSLVASGLEKPEVIAKWAAAYKNYVPLMREEVEEQGLGTGMGYSVRGPASRRAMGSDKGVVDVIANLALQRERAIIRAEKNRVAQALYGLAVKNPNTSFWRPVNPRLWPAWSAKQKLALEAELLGMGLDPLDAAGLVREPVQRYVDPRDGLVHERVNPALRGRDNVISLRVNGEDRFVFFNATDERAARMAHSLKSLDVDQLGRVLTASSVVSRWFASVNTQYNPIFGVVNLTRDVQGALFNLSTTPIAGKQKEVLGHTASALRGIYADIRAHRAGQQPSSKWAQLWEEFQREGGQTGFRDMWANAADRTKGLEEEIRQIGQGRARSAGRAIFNWLSDYNDTLENATRLAAYKVALDQGISKQQAASIAKNLTVNFNRKGQVTQQAGALYAFFNASVQGTARLAETLTGPMGKKIVAGGLILGVAQAMLLAAAGFDDDDPPDFVRERNLVIPVGGSRYVSIPMPLGLHVLPGISRITTEWVLSGFRKPADRVAALVSMLAETFNPIGNAGLSLQTITPTAVDPLAALAENRDFSGRPIARENVNSLQPKPGFALTRDSASWVSKQLSYWLNLASGGTEFVPGLLSPTPDQIDYLIGQVTGGVGRELLKAQQTASSLASGEELTPHKVPLAGRFLGDASSSSSEAARYYDNLKSIYAHKAEMDGRRRQGESTAIYMRENPAARLVTFATQTDRDIDDLKKDKREAARRGATPEQLRRLDDQGKARMAAFNRRVEALRQ
jgi:hypothetical protein